MSQVMCLCILLSRLAGGPGDFLDIVAFDTEIDKQSIVKPREFAARAIAHMPVAKPANEEVDHDACPSKVRFSTSPRAGLELNL